MIRSIFTFLSLALYCYGSDSLLKYESVANAKDVSVQVFNQASGKPAGKFSYKTLERSRPKLGPLTVNLQVLRVTDFHIEVNLDESGSAGFHKQMASFMEARPLRFVEASPARIQTIRNGKITLELLAGKIKLDRKGQLELTDGVKLDTNGRKDQFREGFLLSGENPGSWLLLKSTGEVVLQFSMEGI